MALAEEELTLAAQIGQKIRALREAKTPRWSQEKLARRAEASRQSIAKYEAGRWFPQIEVLGRIAAALEVDWKDLLPTPDAVNQAHTRWYLQTPSDLLLPSRPRRRKNANPPQKRVEARTG